MLPPGHPGLVPHGPPLWEREWKGGEGKEGNEDPDDSDDNDGDDNQDDHAGAPEMQMSTTQGTKPPTAAAATRGSRRRGKDSD